MGTRLFTLFRCMVPTRSLPLSILLLFFAVAVWALTVPSTIFEVADGNTIANGVPNCDWNTLNGAKTVSTNVITDGGGTPCVGDSGSGPNAYIFLVGDTSEKVFTTGGSKDSKDPQDSWQWTSGATPDKDLLTHAYAASYTGPDGHKVLVYGGERFAVNGDANIGVWFFQNTVQPAGVGKNGFTGHHQDGDVFAVSAFTNGGGHPGLDVYIWDATAAAPGGGCPNSHYPQPPAVGACADTNLRLIFHAASGSPSLCSGSDPACTAVNGVPISTSWPYTGKNISGNSVTQPQPNAFFEGGFDLTALFPGGAPGCFSSFLMETRSSQSTDAVLKDFLSGTFPECSFTVSKSCSCSTVNGNTGAYTYGFGGTVKNTGAAPLFNVTVTDTAPDGDHTYNCGTLPKKGDAGDTKNWPADCSPATPTTFTSTISSGLLNTANATAQTSSGAGAGTINASNQPVQVSCGNAADVPACSPIPLIDVTKACSTSVEVINNQVAVRVNYTGKVKNTSTTEALLNVSVNDKANTDINGNGGFDDPANPLSLQPLDSVGNPMGSPCTSCTLVIGQEASFSGSYVPTNAAFVDSGGQPIPGRARLDDKVTAVGTGKVSGTQVSKTALAHCVVCPAGSCPP
jgi:hypothetical protein